MAKKKSRKYPLPLIVAIVIGILAAGGFLTRMQQNTKPPVTLTNVATPTPAADLTGILASVAVTYPSAPWSEPAIAKQSSSYGQLSGAQINAQVVSQTAYLDPFMSATDLARLGFTIDGNLYANGAGSGVWGYKRTVNNKSQVLVFSYATHPTSQKPDEPLQFVCPCKMDITVFVSSPF